MHPSTTPDSTLDGRETVGGAFVHVDRAQTLTVLLRGEPVTPCLVRADRMLARMRGLLGRRALAQGEGLWITPCSSIHMFFMRHPIDAVFVDERLQVVRVHAGLRPWRLARGGRDAHSVLELAPGTVASSGIREGDALTIVRND